MAISETILGAVLGVVLDKLATKQVVDFLKSSKLDQPLLKKLKRLMLVAEKLLADAEDKQMTDSAVKSWLNELKHLFFRAEEIVDEISTEALRPSVDLTPEPESLMTKVRNWIPFSSSSTFATTVNSKISEVVTQLEYMVSQSSALNLREGSDNNNALGWVPTSSMLEDTEVFGRKKEKKDLLELLLSEEVQGNKISVVAIVGMGGLGKTTLAKMVYNDDSLGSFDLKAWVYVSDQFDVSRVTKSIIEAITGQSHSGSLELSVLQYELGKMLKEKRFLLVLDDVWNEKYQDWERLRAPLSDGASGSKVIVTTRNDGVASIMRTSTTPVIRLPLLSDDDGWLLLSKHAFGVGNLSSNQRAEFLDTGKAIVEKCKGLPLAIKTVGGLLRCRQDIKEWEAVLKSSVWDLPDNKSNVVPALRLSYNHLPSHLKRCFAYCAIFPKGYTINPFRLVLLWMAENFVQSNESSRRTEDIGEEYIGQLLSRSFFERKSTNKILSMHDLMHDLAQDVSGEFVALLENEETTTMISEKARHIVYLQENFNAFLKFEPLRSSKFLRTFKSLPVEETVYRAIDTCDVYYMSNKIPIEVIPKFYCLRVLCLSDYEVLKLPESIKDLKQLRFLDVSNSGIKELPESVCNLYHLQTLLLHNCKNLERLPAKMSRLVSLRHLTLGETSSLKQMPQQMSKLTSLQTLTAFVVSKHGGSSIKELKELQQIRGTLCLRGLQNVSSPDDALDANLSCRDYLTNLRLDENDSEDSEHCRLVLGNLKPHVNLEELWIKNYHGTRFPGWLDNECSMYTKLVTLSLRGCQYCSSLPPLGLLPSLRGLEIIGMDCITSIGSEFYGCDSNLSNPFPSLDTLIFNEMKSWEVWSGHEMEGRGLPFPCLERLSLINCPLLEGELPGHLTSLKDLHTEGCNRLQNSFLPGHLLSVSPGFASLVRLFMHNLVQLVSLPPEVGTLSNLEMLSLHFCPRLVSLNHMPPNIRFLRIEECEVLESLPKEMFRFRHLREFSIVRCPCLCSYRKKIIKCRKKIYLDTWPTSLEMVTVESCKRWEFVLFDIRNTSKMQQQRYASLVFINIEDVGDTLVSIPLGAFPKLQTLQLWNCVCLEAVYIPTEIDHLTSLQDLIVKDCPKLKYIGKTEEAGAVFLPAPNLVHLWIELCDILKPLSGDREGLPSNLKSLCLDVSEKITSHRTRNARSLHMFSSLRFLSLRGQLAECFPDEGILPVSITILQLGDSPELKFLNGKALKSLTSIQELWTVNCQNLQRLPEEGLPSSLGLLDIRNCPLVEKRCKRDEGQDWPKICDIPCVKINKIVII